MCYSFNSISFILISTFSFICIIFIIIYFTQIGIFVHRNYRNIKIFLPECQYATAAARINCFYLPILKYNETNAVKNVNVELSNCIK